MVQLSDAELHAARIIADQSPIGIFRADPAGLIVYINPALERISGVPAKRALGQSWLRSAPADSLDMAQREWAAAIAERRNLETEFRFKHPDASIRYASIVMAAEREDDGGVSGFIGFVTDITEQRASQSALRKSERLFRLLAENASDIIVRLDLDDHVTYASPAMGEITGFSGDETRGINPISFMHPDDAGPARECSRQLKAGEIDQAVIEYRTPHKDGHYIWVEARSRLVRNSRGEPQEVISVVRDINEQKKLQADLVEAREAERRASAAQGRFLAAMSHEIRTPISGVLGMIDLLINDPDEVQRPRYRDALAASARTLLRVVDDVLDYSRMSDVGITLEAAPFDVFATVHAAIDLYRPAASAKGLQIGLLFQAPSRFAIGDATRIGQILGNLLSNAIKFTEQGRIDIDISQHDGRWIFAVTDTGIGISSEQQARLFQAFSQADDSIASRFGGSGLGLVIARLIIEAMGGSIRVESSPGGGATFTVEVALPFPGEGQIIDNEHNGSRREVRSLRVLVADDNEVNFLYLTRLLASMGHDVTAVKDGAAAVEAAKSQTFDAILLDRHMPIINGDEAARLIDRGPPERRALVVLVSAADTTLEGNEDLVDGLFDARVPKPVRREQLLAVLARCAPNPADSADEGAAAPCEVEGTLGRDAAIELKRLFRVDIEDRMEEIEAAIARGDREVLRQQAHAMLGAAQLIGEQGIIEAAQRVENDAAARTLANAITLHQQCRDYLSVKPKI